MNGLASVSDNNNFIMLQQNIRLSGVTVVVTGAAGFIGASLTRRLLDFVTVLQEGLVRAGVLPEDYDFESHRERVPMQSGDVPVTYADTALLERYHKMLERRYEIVRKYNDGL